MWRLWRHVITHSLHVRFYFAFISEFRIFTRLFPSGPFPPQVSISEVTSRRVSVPLMSGHLPRLTMGLGLAPRLGSPCPSFPFLVISTSTVDLPPEPPVWTLVPLERPHPMSVDVLEGFPSSPRLQAIFRPPSGTSLPSVPPFPLIRFFGHKLHFSRHLRDPSGDPNTLARLRTRPGIHVRVFASFHPSNPSLSYFHSPIPIQATHVRKIIRFSRFKILLHARTHPNSGEDQQPHFPTGPTFHIFGFGLSVKGEVVAALANPSGAPKRNTPVSRPSWSQTCPSTYPGALRRIPMH